MTEAQQYELGSYVNLMLSSTQLLVNPIMGLQPKYSDIDFEKYISWNKNHLSKEICIKYKSLIVLLSNLLYKIKLDDNDRKLLYKSFRKNKKMLSAFDMKKSDFSIEIMNIVNDALIYKYQLNHNNHNNNN